MKKIAVFLLLCIVIMLTGCPKDAPKLNLKDDGYKDELVIQLKKYVYYKEWVEYKCSNDGFYNKTLSEADEVFETFDCGDDVVKNADNAKRIRNEVLDSGLGLIDSAYSVYIRNIRKNRSIGEFIADLLQIGGSTAVGIVNGERALQVIGVALTGFSGGRKSANLNFYDEKTTTVLLKRMDASRSQIQGEIETSKSKSTDEYSFDAALKHIVNYFDAGTLNRAFTDLDIQASVDAAIAKKGVLRIKGLDDISAIPTQAELAVLVNIDKKLTELEGDLENQNKVGASSKLLMKIYDKIAAKPEFAPILTRLQDPIFMAADNTRSQGRKDRIEVAFFKVNNEQPLIGEEYWELVNAVFSETERTPALQSALQTIFNETK